MELKLNVYKNQHEIEKTYTADTYDLLFGTIDDFAHCLDLHALTGNNGNLAAAQAAYNLVSGGLEMLKPLLKDVFPGLTDDELRRTKAKELIPVAAGLCGFTMEQLHALVESGKKVLAGQTTR